MTGSVQAIQQQYFGRFAWPTVIFAFMSLGILIGSLTLLYHALIPLWCSMLASGLACYLAFTPLHEAAHGNIRGAHARLRWIEYLLGHVCAIMLVGPFDCFAFLHLTHHAHTNQDRDPDKWAQGNNLFIVFLRCLTIIPHYYLYFFTSKNRKARQIYPKTIITFLIMALFIVVLSILYSWKVIILGWILPSCIANAALAFVLDFIPHAPHTKLERYQNTNIIFGNLFYYISMAHSYHIIHHLWPRIPFYHYKTIFNAHRAHFEQRLTPIYGSLAKLLATLK